VKVKPEAWLDSRVNTRPSEMVGGPGHRPPDMASPPVNTRIESTRTHTGVTPSLGCQLTSTVPLAQAGPLGFVDASAIPPMVVRVAGEESAILLELTEADGEEQPTTDRLAATTRASRHFTTPAT
jgi:hypothetical protein